MQTFKLRAHTDSEGTITLQVPVGTPDREVEVVVVIEALPLEETDALGWPVGYFEQTYGSMADDPIERPAQLPLDVRDEIE